MRPILATRINPADNVTIVEKTFERTIVRQGKSILRHSTARFFKTTCPTCGNPIERPLKLYKPGCPNYCNPSCMWARNKKRNEAAEAAIIKYKVEKKAERKAHPKDPIIRDKRVLNLEKSLIIQISSPTECTKCKIVQPTESIMIRDERVCWCGECYQGLVESMHGTGTSLLPVS